MWTFILLSSFLVSKIINALPLGSIPQSSFATTTLQFRAMTQKLLIDHFNSVYVIGINLPNGVDSTTLTLTCNVDGSGMQVIQTWENFPFNNYGVISVYGDQAAEGLACTIATDTNNVLVNEASAQVTLTYGVNPLGDNLLQLTLPQSSSHITKLALHGGYLSSTDVGAGMPEIEPVNLAIGNVGTGGLVE